MSSLRTAMLIKRNKARALKPETIIGKAFGMLKPIIANGRNRNGSILMSCVCNCGSTSTVPIHALISGNTKSCGVSKVWLERKARIRKNWQKVS